mgnify:CR=1 FL=1
MKRLLTMLLSFCMILSIGAHTAAAAETTLLEAKWCVIIFSG